VPAILPSGPAVPAGAGALRRYHRIAMGLLALSDAVCVVVALLASYALRYPGDLVSAREALVVVLLVMGSYWSKASFSRARVGLTFALVLVLELLPRRWWRATGGGCGWTDGWRCGPWSSPPRPRRAGWWRSCGSRPRGSCLG
jgi:hypothetical protein